MNLIVQRNYFRVREYLADSDKVIFVFTAMGTGIPLYGLFVKGLNKLGYSVIIYDYPLELLFAGDLDKWMIFYDDIILDVGERITSFQTQDKTKFYAYGVSMGTLIANKCARDLEAISHLILNLTYGDVATNIWTYRGVKKTKQSLIKQGITTDHLREKISYVDPIVNAPKLKGKKVLLHLSRPDRVLRYDQTKYTKEALEAAGIDLVYHENRYLGHWAGAVKNMLNLKAIDKFYRS